MTINQTNNNNQSACESVEASLPLCLGLIFPDSLKNSCIRASLNGHTNPSSLSNVKKWGNCAAFTVNGNSAFMMRGCRGYISMVIEGGEAIFLADIQFWSENAIFNSTSDVPSPYECLTAFYLNIEMMIEKESLEGAEQAMAKLFFLLKITQFDGFLPKHELAQLTPKIEQLVLKKFYDLKIMFAEYDFSIDYAGNFITGSINLHTFEITRQFNGENFRLEVLITSQEHLKPSENRVKVLFSNLH